MEGRSLLISDVDNTLLGDDEALDRFASWYGGMRDDVLIAYSSGRFVDSIIQSVASTALPEPDAMIGGVGTDVRIIPWRQASSLSSGPLPDDSCDEYPRVDGWPQAGDWDNAAIRAVLAQFSELEPQPGHLQSEFKISYFAVDLSDSFLRELRDVLQSHGFATEVVYSSNRDLDVLPRGVNKGSAAAYLAAYLGFDREHVIVSGDSGNDLAMFLQGFRGVVVANAHPELKELDDPRVFKSVHSYAAGVLDGVQHWTTEKRRSQ